MDNLPKDPDMLLSYLNMKLRDSYSSVDELCEDMNLSQEEFSRLLTDAGLEYFPDGGRFVRI